MPIFDDLFFMREALKEARMAFEEDEVPVGAVIVKENTIIARAHNQNRRLADPTAHAEILAITQAANKLNCQFLYDCSLYVTLEPCIMCTGALVLARIKRLIYGADEPEFGAVISKPILNNVSTLVEIKTQVLMEESKLLLKSFFKRKRMLNKMERWLSG